MRARGASESIRPLADQRSHLRQGYGAAGGGRRSEIEHLNQAKIIECEPSRNPLPSSVVKLRLVIEFDPEVRRWSAVFPELPGCASAGDTEEEAVANAKEALALWFEPADVPLPQGAKVLELALP